jgi:hypothetical protein
LLTHTVPGPPPGIAVAGGVEPLPFAGAVGGAAIVCCGGTADGEVAGADIVC